MEKLDSQTIEDLLELNPQVDRAAIAARREKVATEDRHKVAGDSASPYGGKRARIDDRIKWRSVSRSARRTGYQSM